MVAGAKGGFDDNREMREDLKGCERAESDFCLNSDGVTFSRESKDAFDTWTLIWLAKHLARSSIDKRNQDRRTDFSKQE